MMLSLDTNVLARYLLGDDIEQQYYANLLISNNDCVILMTVILELAWVLKSQKIHKAIIIQKLIEMSQLPTIQLENEMAFKNAMKWAIKGMDIADAIHLALSQHYSQLPMATFDMTFIKKSQEIDNMDNMPICQNVIDLIK